MPADGLPLVSSASPSPEIYPWNVSGEQTRLLPATRSPLTCWPLLYGQVLAKIDMSIYLDADACPVKEEVYRVAHRYQITVHVVANSPLRVPAEDLIALTVVKGGFDAADDWIAERIGRGDIAITTDIPLADRCLQRGARVLGPKGDEFTEDSMGNALATRLLLDMLRQAGEFRGGPAPFTKSDRSRFLAKLDEVIHAVRRDVRG